MLKVGLIGVGHLGKFHLEQFKQIAKVELIGIYDIDLLKAKMISEQYEIPFFENADALINACDAIDVVSTTSSHYEVAENVIRKGKHIFIEKPMAANLEDAKKIMDLVSEAGVRCQIGHVERFNPAFLAVKDKVNEPMFIECHRLAQFNPRGADVSVVFDLMIHDIDIILSLVNSDLKRIAASGVNIISDTTDIANVRLEFSNGCVANLTASRISLKKMRKMRIFQRDAYLSVDFLDKKTEIITIKDDVEKMGLMDFPIELNTGKKRIISVDIPKTKESNAIKTELEFFVDSIINNKPTVVTAQHGYMAMEIAYQILTKTNERAIQ